MSDQQPQQEQKPEKKDPQNPAFRAIQSGGHGGILHAHATAFFQADEAMPLSKHLLLLSIMAFFIIFVVWANIATLDEVTRGEGKIIPSSEVQALQSLDPGIVEEFLVKEGDEVNEGQVLVRLRDIEASSDLSANQARYLGILASITRLQAQAEGKETVEFPKEVKLGAPNSVREEMNAFKANQQQLIGQINVMQQQKNQRTQELSELRTRIQDVQSILNLHHWTVVYIMFRVVNPI